MMHILLLIMTSHFFSRLILIKLECTGKPKLQTREIILTLPSIKIVLAPIFGMIRNKLALKIIKFCVFKFIHSFFLRIIIFACPKYTAIPIQFEIVRIRTQFESIE